MAHETQHRATRAVTILRGASYIADCFRSPLSLHRSHRRAFERMRHPARVATSDNVCSPTARKSIVDLPDRTRRPPMFPHCTPSRQHARASPVPRAIHHGLQDHPTDSVQQQRRPTRPNQRHHHAFGTEIRFRLPGASIVNDTMYAIGSQGEVSLPTDSVARLWNPKISPVRTVGMITSVLVVGIATLAILSFGQSFHPFGEVSFERPENESPAVRIPDARALKPSWAARAL